MKHEEQKIQTFSLDYLKIGNNNLAFKCFTYGKSIYYKLDDSTTQLINYQIKRTL